MPLAIVFVPQQYGGIEMQNLYTEQGIRHVMYIIQNIRAKSHTGETIITLLETYQQESGLEKTPTTNPKPIQYVDAPWTQTTLDFLHHINATIEIPQIKPTTKNRKNDSNIMEEAIQNKYTTAKLKAINNCRKWLQIYNLSDITHADRTTIIKEAITGEEENNKPKLWQNTQSTQRWKPHPRPNQKEWKIWENHIRQHCRDKTNKLKTPLGDWYQTINPREWKWKANQSDAYNIKNNQIIQHEIKSTRTSKQYSEYEMETTTIPTNAKQATIDTSNNQRIIMGIW